MKGQFASQLVNIIFWLMVIIVVGLLIYKYVVGGANWIPLPGQV